MHQAVLSFMLSNLLSRADDSVTVTIPSNVKISAPLKSYTREITQMSHISRHIWAHVGDYSDGHKQPQLVLSESLTFLNEIKKLDLVSYHITVLLLQLLKNGNAGPYIYFDVTLFTVYKHSI
jgi:hypothetical protein